MKQKLNCILLVDDDESTNFLNKMVIEEVACTDKVMVAESGLEALRYLTSKENGKYPQPDLMFLDINMPKISGIELLRSLQNPPKVIIISAHKEYAIEGFNLDAIDYLLKPISFERFLRAINKFKHQNAENNPPGSLLSPNFTESNNIISIKDNKKLYNINQNQILYIESMREYIKFHLEDDETIVIKQAISKLEESLPSDLFIRTHKSFIVPIQKVRVLSATYVQIGKKQIPIGRNFKHATFKALSNMGLNI